jgi:hypothetical protein
VRRKPFDAWSDSTLGDRPDGYRAFKASIEQSLLAQFARHFPVLAPMIVTHELSTPLTGTRPLRSLERTHLLGWAKVGFGRSVVGCVR